jgi:LAO/AO transport system kinase
MVRVASAESARSSTLSPADRALIQGVLARQPRQLAKTITLIESSRRDHQDRAQAILESLLPNTGDSIRIGISGPPGVGKSTFVEALGLYLIERGHRVAVLAVDPTSAVSGGSIMGDKTRMERLSQEANAYIRPSPTAGSLGGVAEKTREAMLVCEAAGHDVIIVETVGVGQSEITAAAMVDFFVLLQLPNAGDELQAIKKGIVELADIIVINKADIDPRASTLARRQMQNALTLLRPASANWTPPVIEASALKASGIAEFWEQVSKYRTIMERSGELQDKRRRQALAWMWNLIDSGLRANFRHHPRVRALLASTSAAVAEGRITPAAAAHRLLKGFES